MNETIIEKAAREYAERLVEEADMSDMSMKDKKEIPYFTGAEIESIFKYVANWALSHQWISVDDGFPKENSDGKSELVFVRLDIGGGEYTFNTNYTKNGKWEFNKTEKVTHWMPIPKLLIKD